MMSKRSGKTMYCRPPQQKNIPDMEKKIGGIYLNLRYMWNMETVCSKEMIIDGSFLLLSSTSYALREQTGRSTTSVESRAAIAWLWLSACQLHKTMGTKSWEGTVGQWFSIPPGNSTQPWASTSTIKYPFLHASPIKGYTVYAIAISCCMFLTTKALGQTSWRYLQA